jgi:hypothetical protein
MHPPPNPDVEKVFLSYPQNIRAKLYLLRDVIFQTASSIDAVGPVSETLKWGEPAYLTLETKSGSTIRIGWKKASPTQYAMYFNCRTSLVDTFRTLFPELVFEGNRALLFEESRKLPADSVSKCIELALTYHLDQRSRQGTEQQKFSTRGGRTKRDT